MRDNAHHNESSGTPRAHRATARQRRLLELASIGFSDIQIAASLRVSPREIRFEFEKVFRALGVRNRSDAIEAWVNSKDRGARPSDECPYPKPFSDLFAACPAYLSRQIVTLDERGRPTDTVWTCRNLESRSVPGTDHRWYGACVLGDAGLRERWADDAGPHRLRMINHLLHALAPRTSRFALDLWTLKVEEVRAVTQRQGLRTAQHAMGVLADRFIADIQTFLDRHRPLLEENGLPIDECLSLARRSIDQIIAQRSADWSDPFDALMRFPDKVWSASAVAMSEDPDGRRGLPPTAGRRC